MSIKTPPSDNLDSDSQNERRISLRRSAGETLSYVDILRQKLKSNEFQVLLELCVRNPGTRPALAQHERIEFNAAGSVTKINLSGLPVKELSPLGELKDLISLDLSMTQVTSLFPLTECENLSRLWLDQTELRDLSPMTAKPLTVLMMNQTKVVNLEILKTFPRLEFLGLEGTPVISFEALEALPKLKHLNIGRTRYDSLSELRACVFLHTLLAPQCRIRSLAPLSKLHELVKVDLSWNQVTECSALHALPKLRELNLAGNPLLPRAVADTVQNLKQIHGNKVKISL